MRQPCSCQVHCGDDAALRTGGVYPCALMTRWLLSHEGTALADHTQAQAARDEQLPSLPVPWHEHSFGGSA